MTAEAPGLDDAELDDADLLRYARQIVLREVGGRGQQRLGAASVAVVGAGGLGSPVLLYLVAAGVGRITIVDDDTVNLDNLGRQVVFTEDDVGAPKAARGAERLAALNSRVTLTPRVVRLTPGNADELLGGHDLIVECSDSFATKLAVADAGVRLGIPAVTGAVVRLDGQVVVAVPGNSCYRCLVLEEPDPAHFPTCSGAGVLGPVAGMVGSLQASEALRLLLGAGEPQGGSVHVIDALVPRMRCVPLPIDPRCPNHPDAGAVPPAAARRSVPPPWDGRTS